MAETKTMKLGSLFDGSGGFPLAGSLCGIEPVWAAEVEPYPIAVTRSRFPNMKHLGDISKVNGAVIEPVDIITFGSPCQDLSVAGKRAGLKHEANGDEETTRSGLFMEAVRIIKEMREETNGVYPAFAVWESVPGAFSSNNGEDFRVVLEELIKIVEPAAAMPSVPKGGWAYADSFVGDGWSLAYRVFDAQYWGVPQRRRRIYLVADFRGERAREILFEREGLRGYFEAGRTPWQTTPADAQRGVVADDREGEGFDGYNGDITGDVSSTLGVNCGISTGRNGVVVKAAGFKELNSAKARSDGYGDEPSPTLSAEKHDACAVCCVGFDAYNQAVTGNVAKSLTAKSSDADHTPVVAYTLKIRSGCEGGGKGALVQEDKSATLATNNDQYLFQPVSYDARGNGDGSTVNTITGDHENRITDYSSVVVEPYEPVICLQGNGIDRADTAGCNGKGWKEDTSYTLNTIDRPAVVYAVDQGGGKSAANVSEDTAPTLCTTHGGEPAVAYGINGDVAGTLDASCYKGCGMRSGLEREVVAYGLDRASFNQGKNALFDFSVLEEQQPTITARGPGGCSYCIGNGQAHDAVKPDYELCKTLNCMVDPMKVMTVTKQKYIVRRLTPTECARLQGFPDWWSAVEKKDNLTDEEYAFWTEVRATHAVINGKEPKTYGREQMLTWYNKLWTDSAEYKMWGNGIALPCALYVMQGIAEAILPVCEKGEDTDA